MRATALARPAALLSSGLRIRTPSLWKYRPSHRYEREHPGSPRPGHPRSRSLATASPEVTLDRSVKVRVVSDGGTAGEGTDYAALDEVVTFNSGTVVGTGTEDSPSASATTANPLQAIVDSMAEADETVVLQLAPLSTADRAYNLGASPPSTTVTILDDDGASLISAFSIDDTSSMAENEGRRTFTVTLTSAANSALLIPVNATLDGGKRRRQARPLLHQRTKSLREHRLRPNFRQPHHLLNGR